MRHRRLVKAKHSQYPLWGALLRLKELLDSCIKCFYAVFILYSWVDVLHVRMLLFYLQVVLSFMPALFKVFKTTGNHNL